MSKLSFSKQFPNDVPWFYVLWGLHLGSASFYIFVRVVWLQRARTVETWYLAGLRLLFIVRMQTTLIRECSEAAVSAVNLQP